MHKTFLTSLVTILVACTGQLESTSTSTHDTQPKTPQVPEQNQPATPTNTSSPVTPNTTPVTPNTPNKTCTPTFTQPKHPLYRLTPHQYKRLLHNTFGTHLNLNSLALPEVTAGHGTYSNDASLSSPQDSSVELQIRAAESATKAIFNDTTWSACDLNQLECAQRETLRVSAKLFRRPLTVEEAMHINSFIQTQSAEDSPQVAASMAIEAVLQSPHLLYNPEAGTDGDAPKNLRRLAPHELAARVSLFLWNQPPDEALVKRIADAGYDDAKWSSLLDHVIQDSRTEQGFKGFTKEWFALDELEHGADFSKFPELAIDTETLNDLKESALLSMNDAFWRTSSTQALFTQSTVYVNDRIAPFFDLPKPGSQTLVPMKLEGTRAGILTHPTFLAATSKADRHSTVNRGVLILENILCREIPLPPPEVNDELDKPQGQILVTNRDILTNQTSSASCAGCHIQINGIGFAFEAYDVLGRWRSHDAGEPVNSSGELGTDTFQDARGLGALLASHPEALKCMSRHLFRYGMGRRESREELCQINMIADSLKQSKGNLRGMVHTFLMSPTFRYMPLGATP